MTGATAQEVPLTEQLLQVPALSRLVINDGEYSTTYIQVGVLMHKAADLIDAQAARITALRIELGQVCGAATELVEFAKTGHITGPTFADRVRVENLITNLRDVLAKEQK